MKRILFVDDEPRILEGLQRMLRTQRREWEMEFALGGGEAVAACQNRPFDVIVSDMRMPGMDGATLLAYVQEHYPETVRIILSGHTDLDAAARATRVAHQFLMKPSSADAIREVIEKACQQQRDIHNRVVLQVVGSVGTLPAVPALYAEITELLNSPEASLEQLSNVIGRDVAMSAKLLQLVNSSFFGFSRRVTRLRNAVELLGMNTLKTLVLSVEVFRAFRVHSEAACFSVDALQRHSLRVARLATELAAPAEQEHACTGGLLHDLGKLVLADRLPEVFEEMVQRARAERVPLYQIERETLEVTHAEIGAHLLGLWHLPEPVVRVVAHHHQPGAAGDTWDALGAVHVANALCHEIGDDTSASISGGTSLDDAYLRQCGVADRLPGWRAGAVSILNHLSSPGDAV